jgi:hypothetical protein
MRLSHGSTVIWVIDNTTGNAGLWTLTDTLGTDVAISLISPADGYQNPINPVSGYSQDISFKWTKPTTGSISYQVRIYASDGSTILTTGEKAATDVGEPNLLIGPDQTDDEALQYAPGTTYYWCVRTSSPVYSPWSEKRAFSIETLGAQVPDVLAPQNGASITATNPAFSWSPIAQTETYEFQLALSSGFSKTLVSEKVTTSGFRPLVKLDTGMTYFWRVRALEPVVGEWSAISNFTVEGPPPEAPPPVEIVQTPPPVIQIPAAPPANVIEIPPAPPPPAQIAPGYIWAIIIIGAVLVIAVIVLIVRTRRTV